jgi:predicted TIM-barrel fold metal-dependent hydrolase
VLVHCDADTPFPKPGAEPAYLLGIRDLFLRHPKATIIWAHMGVGRVVRPVKDHMKYIARALDNPKLAHVYFDLSWNETAKYVVATPDTVRAVATVIAKHPDRFLFGTDEVGPKTEADELRVYEMYQPLWKALKPADRELVLHGNYERIFDEARRRVRAWEADQEVTNRAARR